MKILNTGIIILANEEKGSEKDNRNLQDSDSNQKLSREEIEQMKADGVSREVFTDDPRMTLT